MKIMIPETKPDFSCLAEKWPSPVVARREFGKFTGGLISAKYMANLDSQGLGPEGRFRIGKRGIGYFVSNAVAWLEKRAENLPQKNRTEN